MQFQNADVRQVRDVTVKKRYVTSAYWLCVYCPLDYFALVTIHFATTF